jgi:hypothetical protein
MEREFQSTEKKREGDREAAGEGFLSSDTLYHCFFWYWGWERGAAKVALTPVRSTTLLHVDRRRRRRLHRPD